jgi:hypothetical protein
MSRIKRGWALTKKSWGLLRENPELLRFPLYGGAATIVAAIIVVGPGVYLIESDQAVIGGALAVIGFYLLAVIGTYFSVGLAAAANMIFQGQQATIADGLAVSRSRFSQIAGWAALSATVGIALNALENQGFVGEIVGRLLAIGWSLITFLAVPVIALEGTGPIQTLKRSSSLFKSRWGAQVTGNIAIGFLVWASASFAGALLLVIGVIGLAISMLISSALSNIFGVALYRYALDGEAVGGFTPDELNSAVRTKGGGRNAPPTATPGTI